jgi:hypothetical protein
MDEKLIEAAVAAVAGALVKAAAEPALSAGRKVWDWLKGRLSGGDAEAAKAIEAAPDRPSAPDKIRGLLKDVLYGDPAAGEALRALLTEAGVLPAVTQTATVTGDHGRVVQIGGSGNQVTTG